MASCLNENRNPATTSTDQNANITLEDCMCPICLSILIEPVSLPCKHVLCMPCFRSNIEESSMCCPMCRVRIATWSRQASRKKCLVDEKRWQQIKTLFPDHVQKRLDGTDDNDEDLRASSRASSCLRLAEPGEIRKEYEDELKKVAEEEEERKRAELEASEALVRKLQEEELRKVNRWQEEKANALQTDEELARQLEEALRKEIVSPPGIRTTRNRPPTLLDKFVSRTRRPSSCDPSPPVQSAKPAQRPGSASLFFPCSKSRTKPKSQIRQEKCVTTSTSKAGNSSETSSGKVVVDTQQPSTSAAYTDVQKPAGSGRLMETSLSSRNVVKSSAKISGENPVTTPNVYEYLQGVESIGKNRIESDTGLINVEGKLCVAGDTENLSDTQAPKSCGSGVPGLDLQKTCTNLAEHLFKSNAVFPGEDFQNLYPHLTSSASNRSSSLYSQLLIDESKVKGLNSPIPDVMLSSCADVSEVSAVKSPSVREVIVLSSDSEMGRESSVVPIMSIPVIDITDSSENNTPVPSSFGAGASGDASTKPLLRALSVTVERLPTPSFSLLHQTSEEEPCTSSQEIQKRSASVESCDSISHELVHFKPIQICPRTPPKRLPNGEAIKPPFVVSTPVNLNKRLCHSPSLHSIPQASTELSPVIKRQLQTLAAERLQQVQVHSKGIETDCDVFSHPSSPFRPRGGLLNCKPPQPTPALASKKLNFDGSSDTSGISRRHFAQIADYIEQNRVESFTLPEDFNVSVNTITKNHKSDNVKKEPVLAHGNKLVFTNTDKQDVSKCAENSEDSVKNTPGRVYSMRRTKKRVRNSQECTAESVKKKTSVDQESQGTPSSIRTIEDWIRSSQEKQKSDLKNMIDTELTTTWVPPKKRLCTRGVSYSTDADDHIRLENNRKTDSKVNKGSYADAVQHGGKVTPGKLKKAKQSNSQTKLEFSREQKLKSDCDSDCSSIGERVAKNRKSKKSRRIVAKEQKKRKFSEFEQLSDERSGKKSGDSGAADLADEEVDLETLDRQLALKLQEQFNFEAKSQVSMYRLRGSNEECTFRRKARSSATIK